MVHGCDRWFLQPTVWEQLSEKRKGFILKSISDDSRSFLQDFEMSVFDDLREQLLGALQREIDLGESGNALTDLYNREYSKLCHDDG